MGLTMLVIIMCYDCTDFKYSDSGSWSWEVGGGEKHFKLHYSISSSQ